MNSRAQGISVNVIIIAAIALVVMVLLIALVLNTGGDVNQGVSACSGFGDGIEGPDGDYMCVGQNQACPEGMTQAPPGRACSDSTEANPLRCCVDLI